jgi:hypothetical protein
LVAAARVRRVRLIKDVVPPALVEVGFSHSALGGGIRDGTAAGGDVVAASAGAKRLPANARTVRELRL